MLLLGFYHWPSSRVKPTASAALNIFPYTLHDTMPVCVLTFLMNVRIRPMTSQDIKQVSLIEREAFPTLWPPTRLRNELDNKSARYLVAYEPGPDTGSDASAPRTRKAGFVERAWEFIKDITLGAEPDDSTNDTIQGFVGIRLIVDEAHITAIAVSESRRGQSIGELLIVSSIDLALQENSKVVTLEARVSNDVAQGLYEKYGFQKMGVRKRYYSDNGEDAVIMTTRLIHSPEYQEMFSKLKEALKQRKGEFSIRLPLRG